MIINVAHEVPQDAYDRAVAVVWHYALYEAGFAGASIQRGEYTCVPDSESADANVLLNAVRHAIDDDEE